LFEIKGTWFHGAEEFDAFGYVEAASSPNSYDEVTGLRAEEIDTLDDVFILGIGAKGTEYGIGNFKGVKKVCKGKGMERRTTDQEETLYIVLM
jgi:hypothetical protein